MTRARLELLQWFGLLAAPLAWTMQVIVGYGVTNAACGPVGGGIRAWEIALTAACGAIAVAAQAAAYALYRELQAVDHDAAGPPGRLRFFAIAALVGNVLFFVVIVLSGFGSIFHVPCHQS